MDDDKKPPAQATEDAVMQQSYPSPIVDGADAQYYQLASHRNQEQDHQQMDHQSAQAGHHGHGLTDLSEHQEQQHGMHGLQDLSEHQDQHEHHGLHELHELQGPPTPQQHHSRASVSADELQLAAQLTQGLAPMMAASQAGAVQDQAQGQQPLQQQESEVSSQSEPNLQEQLEASLQNHERALQGNDHDLQGHHNHGLENHELQDVMPHTAQPHAHHYPGNQAPPPPLHPHLSMDHVAANDSQYQLPGTTPPRKRVKVSRACDECRRKKIKCDAQSEATEQPCSNCRRSNAQCLFSRIPQKRGPSKGYIKELADRINSIEGKLNNSVEGLDSAVRRASADAFASPGIGDENRKRPFSSISGEAFHTPSPSRISAAYTTEHRPILPYVHPEYRPPNPNDLAVKSAAPISFHRGVSQAGLQTQSEAMMDGISQNGLAHGSSHQAEELPEIEDAVFNRYLEIIHPTFPVLASSKARVQSLLWQSPFTLQSAFYNAFFSMLEPFLPAANSQIHGDPLAASRLLSEWEAEGRPRSTATDLVRLQTLVMVAIATDYQGIAMAKGQVGGPSKAEILGRAVGLGYSMRLHLGELDPVASPELDPNSDDNVALRVWWVLVMLDRWHAVGAATPTLISNDNVVVLPGLKHILGDVVFTLIRISYTLGFIIPLAIQPPLDLLPSSGPMISSMTIPVCDALRWVFPDGQTDPILQLSYWHIRLLSELLTCASSGANARRRRGTVLQCGRKLVELLTWNHDLLSPLTHHFVVLASLALLYLLDGDDDENKEARDEAARLGKNVLDFSLSPSPWNAAVRERLAARLLLPQPLRPATSNGTGDAATTDGGAGSAGGQNLQQLADLATAVDGSAAGAGPGTGPAEGEAAAAVKAEDAVASAQNQKNGAGNGGVGGESAAQAGVDVLALLRAGYLTCFEEPAAGAKDGLVI